MHKDQYLIMTTSIWDELVKVAERDGVITKDEGSLIEVTLQSAEKYEKILQYAIFDGIITDAEKKKLDTTRTEILQKGLFQALDDFQVSDDELRLLTKIKDILRILREELL